MWFLKGSYHCYNFETHDYEWLVKPVIFYCPANHQDADEKAPYEIPYIYAYSIWLAGQIVDQKFSQNLYVLDFLFKILWFLPDFGRKTVLFSACFQADYRNLYHPLSLIYHYHYHLWTYKKIRNSKD